MWLGLQKLLLNKRVSPFQSIALEALKASLVVNEFECNLISNKLHSNLIK